MLSNKARKFIHSVLYFGKYNVGCNTCKFYKYCERNSKRNRRQLRKVLVISMMAIVFSAGIVSGYNLSKTDQNLSNLPVETKMIQGNVATRQAETIEQSEEERMQMAHYQSPMTECVISADEAVEEESTEATMIEEPRKEMQEEKNIAIVTEEEATEKATEASSSRKFTDYEIHLMNLVVHNEARGEPFDGKVGVARTILNSLDEGHWGDTIEKVVYYKSRFCTLSVSEENISQEVKDAVLAAIDGYDPVQELLGEPSLYFYSEAGLSERAAAARSTITEKVKVGNHWFYGNTGNSQAHY